jgi:hypothetical protein
MITGVKGDDGDKKNLQHVTAGRKEGFIRYATFNNIIPLSSVI